MEKTREEVMVEVRVLPGGIAVVPREVMVLA